jgi:hypothetical protein
MTGRGARHCHDLAMCVRQQARLERGVRSHFRHQCRKADTHRLERDGRDGLVRQHIVVEDRGETQHAVRSDRPDLHALSIGGHRDQGHHAAEWEIRERQSHTRCCEDLTPRHTDMFDGGLPPSKRITGQRREHGIPRRQ